MHSLARPAFLSTIEQIYQITIIKQISTPNITNCFTKWNFVITMVYADTKSIDYKSELIKGALWFVVGIL